MTAALRLIDWVERGALPDSAVRYGIRRLLRWSAQRRRDTAAGGEGAPLVPIAQPVVKWATEVNRIEDLPRIVRRAADGAADGEVTLGDTTFKLIYAPDHTPGTLDMIFPVTDHGRKLTVAYSGGTAFNFVNDPPHFDTYINSQKKFADLAARGATGIAAPLLAFAILFGVAPNLLFQYMTPTVNQVAVDLRDWTEQVKPAINLQRQTAAGAVATRQP